MLFFSHYFPPEGNAPASRVYEMCRRWVRSGQRVTVVTCAPNVPTGELYEGYRNRLSQSEVIDGIEVVRVWTYLAPNKGTARRIANYVSYMLSATFRSLLIRRPDVIIATSPQFFCGWAGVLGHWLKRAPLIVEIRDVWPETISTIGAIRSSRLLRFLEVMELAMYRAATRIVTVGDGYRRKIEARRVHPDKISVVSNGIDRTFYVPRPASDELRRQHRLEGKFVCSYVGTIGMASGLEVVLACAELLRERGVDDVVFLLVGDGAAREELEAEATRRRLANVVFAGRQPKERIPDYLSTSDCCLVHLRKTALFETVMPSKLFEALAMERPVLLGVRGEAARLLEASGGGLCFEPEDAHGLADRIARLRSDAERRRMGAAGRAFVVRNYDLDDLADRYLGLIRRVCGRAEAEGPPEERTEGTSDVRSP